jgi:hypothetical protein
MNGEMRRQGLSLELHILPQLCGALETLPDSQLMQLAGAVSRISTCGGRTPTSHTEAATLERLATRAQMFRYAMSGLAHVPPWDRNYIPYAQLLENFKELAAQDMVYGLFAVTHVFAHGQGLEEGRSAADARREWEAQQRSFGGHSIDGQAPEFCDFIEGPGEESS